MSTIGVVGHGEYTRLVPANNRQFKAVRALEAGRWPSSIALILRVIQRILFGKAMLGWVEGTASSNVTKMAGTHASLKARAGESVQSNKCSTRTNPASAQSAFEGASPSQMLCR